MHTLVLLVWAGFAIAKAFEKYTDHLPELMGQDVPP